jgi:FkbM family methyltransferase
MDNSQQEMLIKGELLEKETLDSLPSILHPEMTIVDINANNGQWVFHASKIIKKGIIYAIEPDPIKFNKLKNNCLKWEKLFDNNVSMYALPIEISDTGNEIRSTRANSPTSGVKYELNEVAVDITIDSYKLDTLFEPINPDLIKIIDVEGKELRILKGARGILKKGKTKFLIQIHDWQDIDGQNSLVELYNFMKSFGYYPKRIHMWNLFLNKKKYAFHLLKNMRYRLLIG